MAFMDFFMGKPAETKQLPIYNPEQEQLLNALLGGLSSPLGGGLQFLQNILGQDQGAFDAFAAPARRGFEQQTLPTIAERFTGTFGAGSQRSSGFNQAMGQAGRELEESLSAQRAGLQSGALGQIMQLLAPALSPRQYEYTKPREPGILEALFSATAQGAGEGIGGAIPGGISTGFKGLMGLFNKKGKLP